MKTIVLKNFTTIKGETDNKIKDFCFRIVDHYGNDYCCQYWLSDKIKEQFKLHEIHD